MATASGDSTGTLPMKGVICLLGALEPGMCVRATASGDEVP